MSKVIAIPRSKLIQNTVIEHALRTHDLTDLDIEFALNEIEKLNLDTKKLSKFINQIYKLSNTGRFSLTFNKDLDIHIQSKVPSRIKSLVRVSGTEKAWPELYDNNYLEKYFA